MSEVWVHQPSGLERRFRRHRAQLAYDLLARKRKREAILALGCRVHRLSHVPTASRGSLREFEDHVNKKSQLRSAFSLLMTYSRVSGGVCMLAVGELAVRRVSKFEASAAGSGTKLSFGLTSRIQVSCGH